MALLFCKELTQRPGSRCEEKIEGGYSPAIFICGNSTEPH